MKGTLSITRSTAIAAAIILAVLSTGLADAAPGGGAMVVADRASGTISVISVKTGAVASYPLPAGDNDPEPMYVYYSPIQRRVFVGDRANDRVVAFSADTFDVEGTAAAGAGVFHMWGSRATGELWVNNDIDNTTVATIATPEDLVLQGGKPHDVIVDQQGHHGYITVIGVAGAGDYLVQVDARSYEVISRALVGDDPHVSLAPGNPNLYVPAQGSDVVNVLDRDSLASVVDIPVPGAHGAGMRVNGRFLYTTNLPNGGGDALWVIDTRTDTVVGEPVDTPYPVPHNLALTPNGRTLYVTHSGGTSDKVTVYSIQGRSPVPSLVGEITVGLNPFGIAFVP
jgi:DNA-binding beta-propeller fold protein YncE